MPFFDPDTGDTSNVAYALDTHAAVGGEKSLWDSATDFVTKGAPLTGLAAVNSFVNTAVEVDNFFGGDSEKVSIQDEVGDGEFLGQDAQDVKNYYTAHSQGIEAAGLLTGALVPGTAAIKGGSLAVKAAFLAREGLSTEAIASATGLLGPLKARVVQAGLDDITSGSAGLYGSLATQKVAGIATDIGENALQGLVFSAATAATMHASPLLDEQTLGDATTDMFYGAIAGGVVGGVLSGIGTVANFTRKLLTADSATKYSEMVGRLESGNISFANIPTGDKVLTMLDTFDQIPAVTSDSSFPALAGKKLSLNEDATTLAARKASLALVKDGDEDVAGSFFNLVKSISPQDGMTARDTRAQYLTRLTKVERFTGQSVEDAAAEEAADGNTFFINRYAKGEMDDFTKLVSNSPDPASQFAEKYSLRDGATEVRIARASTEFVGPEGQTVPQFANSSEAFDAGHDLFLNKNLQLIVNPDAPNIEQRVALAGFSRTLTKKEATAYQATGALPEGSKPLTGASLIVNTETGAATTPGDTIPVVGDFGKVKLNTSGLSYGNEVSPQSATVGLITPDTTPLEANARYVWAAKRGIQRGDTIAASDVPMLEQMYREGTATGVDFSAYVKDLEKKGVSIEGSALPQTSQELLTQVQDAKNDLLTETLSKDRMDNTTAARLANVSEGYINNGMKASDFKQMSVDPESYTVPNHVKLTYDLGATSQPDGQILRGLVDTQYRVGLIRSAATDAVTKYAASRYSGEEAASIARQLIAVGKSSDADILGVGAKFLTATNSKYNSLGQEMEGIGRLLTKISTENNAKVSFKLNPAVNAIRDDEVASAEWGNFIAARQRTASNYQFLPPELAAREKLPSGTVVLEKSLVKDKAGNIIDWDKTYQPAGFQLGDGPLDAQGLKTFYSLSPKVEAMERAQQEVNAGRIATRNNWRMAQGLSTKLNPDILYTPPIDTTKNPFFALVKMRPGTGMADDGVHVITAATQEEFQSKIAGLSNDFSVFTKDQLKDYHTIKGDYEFSRNFSQGAVNSSMERQGILNNILPDTRAETIIKNYADWNSNQELGLLRDHVELGNAQLFAELRAMGQRFIDASTSQTGFVNSFVKKTVENPYESYIRTALGISSKESQYPLWNWANEKTEAFFDTAFKTAKSAFVSAQKGMIPYTEAAAMSQKFGLGNPYEAAGNALKAYTDVANKMPDPKILREFMGNANAVLGATVIRLDAWQQVMEATSSPIMMLSEAKSALLGVEDAKSPMSQLLRTELPDGTGRTVPSVSKVFFNAIKNYFDDDVRKQWLPIFKQNGIIRDNKVVDSHIEMINSLRFPQGGISDSVLVQNAKKATDFAAKYVTGSDLTNGILHYMTADMGRQIFEAKGYEGKQLIDNIATFQNRVFGNYIAGQRPVAFQGPIGQAIGLFQTYQFNIMQQLFRYVGNNEAKTLAILGGMQSSLFGLQGLPGFQAINNHIVGNAAGNPNHADLYSAIPNLLDPKLGNYLLYGAVSNVLGVGLYGRGDINPRQVTLLPVNPLDYPAISGGIRFMGAMLDTAAKISKGAPTDASLLIGIEHNGLSRPLAGLAQIMQGYATTASGSLISAAPKDNTMGLSDMFSIANFSRLLGARPLDEAITMDAMYRSTLYKAKDNQRIQEVGSALKATMYDGKSPTSEQVDSFATQYTRAGGRIQNFNKFMIKASNDANASIANKVFTQLNSSGLAKNMMTIMGGQPLPDFRNQGSIAGSDDEQLP